MECSICNSPAMLKVCFNPGCPRTITISLRAALRTTSTHSLLRNTSALSARVARRNWRARIRASAFYTRAHVSNCNC
eukprot:14158883-Alexandrium_andersonii.AAC.1